MALQGSEPHFKLLSNSTTLVLKNIPTHYSRSELLDTVCEAGLSGTFDSSYMPINHKTGANKGYAFFSFKVQAAAECFWALFHGRLLWGLNSSIRFMVEVALKHYSSRDQLDLLPGPSKRTLVPAKICLKSLSAFPGNFNGVFKPGMKSFYDHPSRVATCKPIFDQSMAKTL